MTNEQKAEIDVLRQKGLGYKKIAAKVGISENTVKSYLRRIESAPASAEKRAENPFVIEESSLPSMKRMSMRIRTISVIRTWAAY